MAKYDKLVDKLKTLSKDEIETYRKAAKSASRILDIIGVTLAFTGIAFGGMLLCCAIGGSLFMFAKMSVDINEAIQIIDEFSATHH